MCEIHIKVIHNIRLIHSQLDLYFLLAITEFFFLFLFFLLLPIFLAFFEFSDHLMYLDQ